MFYRNLARIDATYFEDALCGASVRGANGIRAVLQVAADGPSVKKHLEPDGKTFAQTIDSMSKAGIISNSGPARDMQTVQKSSFETLEDDIFKDLMSTEQLQLARACREGDFLVVQHIISLREDEDTAAGTSFGGAFSEAIAHQHPGILQLLCGKFSTNKHFATEAVSNVRSTAIFRVLLDHGWTVEAMSSRLKPPILSMIPSEELTQWFLDHGADPNARCDWDITPLSVAVAKGSLCVIRTMLCHGADLRKGQLLHFVLERDTVDQLAIIDMLISFGVPLEARMFENDPASWLENHAFGMGTPLHRAAELGNDDAVAYLLERGATCGTLNSVGRTALNIARAKGRAKIAEMIESRATSTLSN